MNAKSKVRVGTDLANARHDAWVAVLHHVLLWTAAENAASGVGPGLPDQSTAAQFTHWHWQ